MIGTIARLEKITHHYGAQLIVENTSLEIRHDARIGLVGPNAAGKSTLLRMLAGQLEPERGAVHIARGIRTGYLPQEVVFDLDRSVIAEAREASPQLAALESEMEQSAARMGDPAVYGDHEKLGRLATRLEKLTEQFREKGGLNLENRIRSTLRGLGFREEEFELPLRALSGGQKKLIGLAKLLIEGPELLLLDEPDNHLDMQGKQFLEALIGDYAGAVIIVSHDRYLLDIVAEEIAELDPGGGGRPPRLTLWSGNYSEYAFEKQQRLISQEREYHVQQREIRRLELSMRRLMGWGAGQNEKFVRRGRSMQKRLEKIERIEKPPSERRAIGLAFNSAKRGSQKTLEFRRATKAFGAEPLFADADFTIWNGERVGLIGPNGAGKTVLLRCILGGENLTSGEIVLGPSNTLGHYDQEHQSLDPDSTLAVEICRFKSLTNRELYGLLGRFLFTADDAGKKVRDLSGGEKARVQMARLMLQGANFLLLDEPTNHLDIQSAEQLEEALEEFDGTLLAVSHDRYFLDNVVGRILELEDGRIAAYDGNYTAHRQEKTERVEKERLNLEKKSIRKRKAA
jgi:ATP-binding cassette subfamily F protein 3